MSAHARFKKDRYRREGRLDPDRKYRWPKGHPPKAIRNQSGRHVLIVNSGIFEITAKIVGTRDQNRFVCKLTGHHMQKHQVPETSYAVYSFRSKRAMRKWLLSWHRMGDWKPRWSNFKIEWLP